MIEDNEHGPALMPAPEHFTWSSPDGLELGGRQWFPDGETSSKASSRLPVLCLPGLSRNTRDFNDISAFLQRLGHHVIALDYRGRGLSQWDEDWRNYAIPVEEKDIDAAIDHLSLDRFALLGTSRGGLHAMAMAAHYPAERMAAVILNDIGPHLEMRAIHRIAATLGHHMKNGSFEDVASNLKRTIGPQFPSFGEADWLKLAHQLASEKDGSVVMDYDAGLAHQFGSLDDSAPAPDLWPLFDHLCDRPVLILRGEHSDLLSPETCAKMQEINPNAKLHTIPGQGHAPVLWEDVTHRVVGAFLEDIQP